MKTITLLFLLAFIALPASAQKVVDVCPVSDSAVRSDSTAMNTNIGGGPEQIRKIRVVLTYTYAQGDTLHASPAETGTVEYALMDSSGADIVNSRVCNVLDIPTTAMTNAEKILGRNLMDAVRDAIKYFVPDFDD